MADQSYSDLRELSDLAIGTAGLHGLPPAGEVIVAVLRSGKDASNSKVAPNTFHATRAYIARVELVLKNAQRQLEEAQNAATVLKQLREAGSSGQTLERLVQAEIKWREVVQTRQTLASQLYFLHQVQMQETLVQVVISIEAAAGLSMGARGLLSRLGTASDIIQSYHQNWLAFQAIPNTRMQLEAPPSTTVAHNMQLAHIQQSLQTQQHQQALLTQQHQQALHAQQHQQAVQAQQAYQHTQPQRAMQAQQFQQAHHGLDSAQQSPQIQQPTQRQSQYPQATAGPSNYHPNQVQNGQYHQAAAAYQAPQLQNGPAPIVPHNGSQFTVHLATPSAVNGHASGNLTSHVSSPQAHVAQAQAQPVLGSAYLAPTLEPPPSGAQTSYPAASTTTWTTFKGINMQSAAPVSNLSQPSPIEGQRVQQVQQGPSTAQPTHGHFRQQAQPEPSSHLQSAAVPHAGQAAPSAVPSQQPAHATQQSALQLSEANYRRHPTASRQPPATAAYSQGQGQPSAQVQLVAEPPRSSAQTANAPLQPSSSAHPPPAAVVVPPAGLLQPQQAFTGYRNRYAAAFHAANAAAAGMPNATVPTTSTAGQPANSRTTSSQMHVPTQWQQQIQMATAAAATGGYQPGWLPRAPPAPVGPVNVHQPRPPHWNGQQPMLASRPPDPRGNKPAWNAYARVPMPYPSVPPAAAPRRENTSAGNAGSQRLWIQPDRKRVARDILRALQGSAAVEDAATPRPQAPTQGLGKRKRTSADPPTRPSSAQAGPSTGHAGPSTFTDSRPLTAMAPTETVAVGDDSTAATEPRATLLQTTPGPSMHLSAPPQPASTRRPSPASFAPELLTTPPAPVARISEEPADIELSTDVLRSPKIPTLLGAAHQPILLDSLQGADLFANAGGAAEAMRMHTVVQLPPPAAAGTSRNKVPLFWDDSTPSPADATRTRKSPSVGGETAASEDDVAAMLDGPTRGDTSEPEARPPPSSEIPPPTIIDVDLFDAANFDTIPLQDMSPARPVKSATRPMTSAPLVREQPVASGSSLRSIPSAIRDTLQQKQLAILRPPPPVRHQWPVSKPDRLVVELPRLPAGWGSKAPPVMPGYGDFTQRIQQRACEWEGCPAVLDSEDRLSLHMRKIHGEALPADGHCQWSGCTRKFRQVAALQSHLEQTHARSSLRCAYQGCNFHSVSSAALTEHVGGSHARDAISPLARPQQPVASTLPSLPTETEIPTWSLATPIVRAAPMHAQRNLQLGNWVLANVFAKVDLDEVLPIAKRARGRARGDRAVEEQLLTEPLVQGVELDHKQQFNWVDGEQTRKPRPLPSLTVK